MLEYVAANDEIETAAEVLGRRRNIEPRLLMKKGVRIVEFVAKPPSIIIRIGEPYTGEIATPRQLRDSHAPAEQFGREQVHDGSGSHRRPAAVTGCYFTLEFRRQYRTEGATDIASEANLPADRRCISRTTENSKLPETSRYLCR